MAALDDAKMDARRILAAGKTDDSKRLKRLLSFLKYYSREDSEASELYRQLVPLVEQQTTAKINITSNIKLKIECGTVEIKQEVKPIGTPLCPHCAATLEKIPQRKTKCSTCGKDIYVRTDPFKREKILVNHSDAIALDVIRLQGIDNPSGDVTMGINEAEYSAVENELAIQFKHKPSKRDILWGILGQRQLRAMHKSDYQTLSWLYYMQADILQKEENPFRHVLKLSLECQLNNMKFMGCKYVQISANICDKCADLDGKTFLVDEALSNIPLPPESCKRPACFMFLSSRGS